MPISGLISRSSCNVHMFICAAGDTRRGGVEFTWRRKDGSVRRRYRSEAEGLAQAVARTRPRVCFFGHHHTRLDAEIAGVHCIGLNKVAMPGNLVAVDVPPRGRDFEILGEWPGLEPLAF